MGEKARLYCLRLRRGTVQAGAGLRRLQAALGQTSSTDRTLAALYRSELRRLIVQAKKKGLDVDAILRGPAKPGEIEASPAPLPPRGIPNDR